MTVRSLFYYLEHVGHNERVIEAIDKNLHFLKTSIGYKDGVFWYSAADKIKVPNISSMAANAFARASRVLGNTEYLQLAKEFFNYCVDQQHPDGGYSYFEGEEMVYMPYHALEIWELQEANELLYNDRAEDSLKKATEYLTNFFATHGYDSTNIKKKGQLPIILFKTPLWGAKAFVSRGNYSQALKHYKSALRFFSIPRQPYYFYLLKEMKIWKKTHQNPVWESQFIRYNASCFEIGSRILLDAKESR
jgi:tetratricopeptide (TPR) repeat protein